MLTSNGYVLDPSERRLGQLEPVPAEQRLDKEALWGRLRRDGYLYLKGQLDPAMVNEFRPYYFESLQKANVTRDGPPALGIGADGAVDRAERVRDGSSACGPGNEYQPVRPPAHRRLVQLVSGDDVHLHSRKIIRHTKPGESGIGTHPGPLRPGVPARRQ